MRIPPVRFAAPLLALLATAPAAHAQEAARFGVPEAIDLTGLGGALRGGSGITPDGRIIITGWSGLPTNGQNDWPANNGAGTNLPGWGVRVFRPEAVTRDTDNQPDFAGGTFSGRYLLEPGIDPTTETGNYGKAFSTQGALPAARQDPAYPGAVASGVMHKAHTTWFPDPELDTVGGEVPPTNPYACNAFGVPLTGHPAPETQGGGYVAYEMIIVTHAPFFEWFGTSPSQFANPKSWEDRLVQTPCKIVVENPYTNSARVHKAWVTGSGQDMRYPRFGSAWMDKLYLAEMGVTVNGHFLVAQGKKPDVLITDPQDPRFDSWDFPHSFQFGHVIWCSWNKTPTNPDTWTEPVLLSDLYKYRDETVKVVDGVEVPLKDLVRLAAEPLRYPNGDIIGTDILSAGRDASFGAYPWVHWDGDGVLYPIVGVRGTLGYCGVRTNYTFVSLDAANPSHLNIIKGEDQDVVPDVEHVMSNAFALTGLWDVYRDTAPNSGQAILDAHPAHPHEPTMSVIQGTEGRLFNVSFEDWTDGSYQVFLRMNPVVSRHDVYAGQENQELYNHHVLDQAADTSGNYHRARMRPYANAMHATVPDTGAAFIAGTSDARPNRPGSTLPYYRPIYDLGGQTLGHVGGRIGEGIRLGRLGYVEIVDGPHTPAGSDSMASHEISAECFLKPLPEYLALNRARDTQLFYQSERLEVGVTPLNQLRVTLHMQPNKCDLEEHGDYVPKPDDYAIATLLTPPVLNASEWYHIAVTFDDEGCSGVMKCYVDGQLVAAEKTHGHALALPDKSRFLLGPAGSVSGSDDPLWLIDEFRLSSIGRSQEEIRRHAFVATDKVWDTTHLPNLAGTPLTPDDCRVDPQRPWDQAKHDFGQYLFSDPQLSLNNDFSCQSCHDPVLGFTDGLDRSIGHSGALLPLSSPTLLNSITGVETFWDMRAESLADQATQPITTPAEMGFSNLSVPLQRLNADPTAQNLCNSAFGTTQIAREHLEQALESFMQAQIHPTTAVDDYEAGNPSALALNEKRGRALFRGQARCVACHSGAGLNNGLPMNTGAATWNQLGRFVHTDRLRDRGAFKTPTLVSTSDNVPHSTQPYFHDGFADTLDDVVQFYNAGGDPSVVDPSRTVGGTRHESMYKLNLSAAQVADLLAFLRRLGE